MRFGICYFFLFGIGTEFLYVDSKYSCKFSLCISLFMGHLFFFFIIACALFVQIKYIFFFFLKKNELSIKDYK